MVSKKNNLTNFSTIILDLLTAAVGCGEIHELFVVCGNPADVGGVISLFVDGKPSIDVVVESLFG